MKRKLLLISLILITAASSGKGQNLKIQSPREIIPFNWGKIEGIILSKEYKMPPTDQKLDRFTPSENTIIEAEGILKRNIKKLNSNRSNQFGHYPVIHRHLKDYFRQYVGVITENGDSIVHINLLWNKYSLHDRLKGYADPREGHKDGYSVVFDGGSYYWSVNVNLKEKKLFGLSVNGVA